MVAPMRKHTYERTVHDVIRLAPRVVVNPDASSPYQKYGKREYQYSPALLAWQRQIGRKVKHAHDANASGAASRT